MDIYRCTFHWGLLLTGPNKIELFYGVIVQETSHIQVFPDVPHTCLQADTTWSHEKRDREVESYPTHYAVFVKILEPGIYLYM